MPEAPEPREGPGRLVRAIGILGRLFVGAGLLLLFFTVFLLWGTTAETRQHQDDLAQELQAQPIVSEVTEATGEIPPARPETEPAPGQGLFTLAIPELGLRTAVVSGVGHEELKKGPGHFPDSPYPGEDGNVAISGHRTTFGAPFYRLDELEPGSIIDIESGPFRYRYRVREQRIVSPFEVDVVQYHGVNELTLTTCHPRFSAAQRLIVHADYEGATFIDEAPAAPDPAGRPDVATALEPVGQATLMPGSLPEVPQNSLYLLGLSLLLSFAALTLSKRFRMLGVYLFVSVVAGVGLWVAVFPEIVLLLPSNF